jgi:hypothetical protein
MSLINYMKTVTNKRYSYSRVATIRIDVHPTGENPINTTRTLSTQSTYARRTLPADSPHTWQPFTSCR